jgi:hypothetical protein
MCPVAACMRAPILAAPHCRESQMSRMSHGEGYVGTAKTVVVTIPLARAELATTSDHDLWVSWRVFQRAMALSHASSAGLPASVVHSIHHPQTSQKKTCTRRGVCLRGGILGRPGQDAPGTSPHGVPPMLAPVRGDLQL